MSALTGHTDPRVTLDAYAPLTPAEALRRAAAILAAPARKKAVTRRGRGEGTITQRGDGRWMARVDLGARHPVTGKRQRKTVYGDTRAAVAAKLNTLLGKASNHELVATTTPTVEVMVRHWYEYTKATGSRRTKKAWALGTQKNYTDVINDWIVPALGPVRLESLTPGMVADWVTARGPRQTTKTALIILTQALDLAVRERRITYNAARPICAPLLPKAPKAPALTGEQARAMIAVATTHRLGALALAAVAMGARMGELCGLSWANVNLTGAPPELRITQQRIEMIKAWGGLQIAEVKTPLSIRTLEIPPVVLAALKAHRTRQREERLKAGAAWSNPHDLVFTTPTGGMVRGGAATRALHALLAAAEIDAVNFHRLRHTAATVLLEEGAKLEEVSRMLGHANLGITQDIYGDFTKKIAARVASIAESAFGGGAK